MKDSQHGPKDSKNFVRAACCVLQAVEDEEAEEKKFKQQIIQCGKKPRKARRANSNVFKVAAGQRTI